MSIAAQSADSWIEHGDTWWFIPLSKWVITPVFKWTNPTYPIYNQCCNPLTTWDEPPSRKLSGIFRTMNQQNIDSTNTTIAHPCPLIIDQLPTSSKIIQPIFSTCFVHISSNKVGKAVKPARLVFCYMVYTSFTENPFETLVVPSAPVVFKDLQTIRDYITGTYWHHNVSFTAITGQFPCCSVRLYFVWLIWVVTIWSAWKIRDCSKFTCRFQDVILWKDCCSSIEPWKWLTFDSIATCTLFIHPCLSILVQFIHLFFDLCSVYPSLFLQTLGTGRFLVVVNSLNFWVGDSGNGVSTLIGTEDLVVVCQVGFHTCTRSPRSSLWVGLFQTRAFQCIPKISRWTPIDRSRGWNMWLSEFRTGWWLVVWLPFFIFPYIGN